MKSTVPATLVLSPSVPNRVISRIPDSPAVRRRQLSAFPAPSEVTRPLPVTTTIGRPALSRMLLICSPASLRAPVIERQGRGPLQQAPGQEPRPPILTRASRSHIRLQDAIFGRDRRGRRVDLAATFAPGRERGRVGRARPDPPGG